MVHMYVSNCYALEVVDRGSETQLEVGGNLIDLTLHFTG